MNDDEQDKQVREHWGAPGLASPALRARVLSAVAAPTTSRRRWIGAGAFAAAAVIAVVSVGSLARHTAVDDDEVAWLAESDDDPPDMTAYFDLAALDDGD